MLPSTTETSNPFIIALQSKKILDYDKKSDALKEFSDLISKTYFEAGQKTEADTLKLLCIGLHDEVKKYFPFLRIEELKIAFANGVRKEYGEFYGLNIATFNAFIKGWQYSEKRKSAQEAMKTAREREYAPVMSKTEAEYEYKQTLLRQFAKFKETGVLECSFPSFQFKEFEKLGMIKLTNAEKDSILIQAMAKVVESKKIARLNPKSKLHLHQLSDWLKRYDEGKLTLVEEEEIRTEARRQSIIIFYRTITELKL